MAELGATLAPAPVAVAAPLAVELGDTGEHAFDGIAAGLGVGAFLAQALLATLSALRLGEEEGLAFTDRLGAKRAPNFATRGRHRT